jgi:hypothetical protein
VKIAYLLYYDLSNYDGVAKKVETQTQEWKILGHTVEIFCFTREIKQPVFNANQYLFKHPLWDRLKINTPFLDDIADFQPDLIYMRHDFLGRTLSKLLNLFPIVTEVNGHIFNEARLFFRIDKSIMNFFRIIFHEVVHQYVLSRVAGIVTVTKELAEDSTIARFQKPTIFLPNSYNSKQYTPLKSSIPSLRIQLFIIGTPTQPWQGFDIVQKMAQNLPEFDFHIVGGDGESTDNLFYHGYLNLHKYLPIIATCHIAIGTLALYKKNMTEACPLKVREYVSFGFPIIIGYNETAFLESIPPEWALQIDSTKIDQEIDTIRNFCYKNHTKIVQKAELFMFDAELIENKRIEFFKSIINLAKK